MSTPHTSIPVNDVKFHSESASLIRYTVFGRKKGENWQKKGRKTYMVVSYSLEALCWRNSYGGWIKDLSLLNTSLSHEVEITPGGLTQPIILPSWQQEYQLTENGGTASGAQPLFLKMMQPAATGCIRNNNSTPRGQIP